MPPLLPATRVTFHELFRRQEEDGYILGREATGTFITVPEVGIEALELLEGGQTLGHATGVLSEKYEDDVDVASYIQDLMRLGFVNELDGIPVDVQEIGRLRAL